MSLQSSISNTEVRRLVKKDAAQFRELRLEALQKNPEAFTSSYNQEVDYPLELFEEQIKQGAVYLLYIQNQPMGIAALSIEKSLKRAHIGRLWSVYIRDKVRGKKLGRILIEAILKDAENQLDVVQLTVSAENQAACYLYKNLGFIEYGFEKFATKYNGQYYDEILMMKILKPQLTKAYQP